MTELWSSVTQAEQRTRFIFRQVEPVRVDARRAVLSRFDYGARTPRSSRSRTR